MTPSPDELRKLCDVLRDPTFPTWTPEARSAMRYAADVIEQQARELEELRSAARALFSPNGTMISAVPGTYRRLWSLLGVEDTTEPTEETAP